MSAARIGLPCSSTSARPARHGVRRSCSLEAGAERDDRASPPRPSARRPRAPAAPASSRRRVMPSTPSRGLLGDLLEPPRGRSSRGRCSTFVSCGTSQRAGERPARARAARARTPSARPSSCVLGSSDEQRDEAERRERGISAAAARDQSLAPTRARRSRRSDGSSLVGLLGSGGAQRLRLRHTREHHDRLPDRGSCARRSLVVGLLAAASARLGVRSPSSRAISSSAAAASSHATMPSGIGPIRPMPQPPRSSGCWMLLDVARDRVHLRCRRARLRRSAASRTGRSGSPRRSASAWPGSATARPRRSRSRPAPGSCGSRRSRARTAAALPRAIRGRAGRSGSRARRTTPRRRSAPGSVPAGTPGACAAAARCGTGSGIRPVSQVEVGRQRADAVQARRAAADALRVEAVAGGAGGLEQRVPLRHQRPDGTAAASRARVAALGVPAGGEVSQRERTAHERHDRHQPAPHAATLRQPRRGRSPGSSPSAA